MSLEDAKEEQLWLCHTIGFLIHRDKSKIIVASELVNDNDVEEVTTIPMRTVKRIIYLKTPKERT